MIEESSTASHLSVAMTTTGMTQITRGNAATSSSTHGIYFYFQIAVPVIGVLGTAANALVLYALVASKQHRSHVLLVHQNALDLLTSFFTMVTYTIKLCNIRLTGSVGYWLCTTILSDCLAWWGTIASAINLAGITVERYLKVVHPVWSQNKLRGWTEYLAMVAAWIVSFIANVAVVFPTSDVIDGVCYAYMIWKNQKARLFYFVWNFVSFYLVIIFVFVFCYGRILLVIRRQSRVMASHTAEGSGVAQNQCSRIQSSVTRTMVLVSAFYAISWLRIFPVRDPSSVPDISRRCLLCEHTSRIFVHVHESFHLHHQVGSSAHCLSRIASESQRSPAASCAVLQDRRAGRWRCCLSYLTKATACAQFLPRDAMHPRY